MIMPDTKVIDLQEFYPDDMTGRYYDFYFLKREETMAGYLERTAYPECFNILQYHNCIEVDVFCQIYTHEVLGIDKFNMVFIMENRGK